MAVKNRSNITILRRKFMWWERREEHVNPYDWGKAGNEHEKNIVVTLELSVLFWGL